MIKRLLDVISRIIIENIPFFIVLGVLSVFNESNLQLHQFGMMLQNYIIPGVICYNSGRIFHEKYGGIVAVVVLGTVLADYGFQTFLEPIILGIFFGWITKKYYAFSDRIKVPGYEMIFNNLSVAFLGIGLGLVMFQVMPYYEKFQFFLKGELSKVVFENRFIPLLSLVIEPAKIFFLNNIINHGFLSTLGFSQLNEQGKSVFFLLETNPGPGLGILVYYYFFEKRKKNTGKLKEVKANILIQFIGGIHEVYFPYVLRNLKLIGALVAGGMSGSYMFQSFNAGLAGIASPGSIILLLLLAPLEDKLHVLLGVAVSAAVSFFVAYAILGKKEEREEIKEFSLEEEIQISKKEKIEICVACDAGMGSSAMGATLLKKKLEKEGIKNIKVINSAIDSVPESANIIVVHRQLVERLKADSEEKDIFVIDDFMDGNFYELLVKKIKESLDKKESIYEDKGKKEELQKKERHILEKENIYLGLKRTDKTSALTEAGRILVKSGYVEEEYIEAMIERENLASTYLDYGIAIPHCTSRGVKYIKSSGMAILQYPYGIDYGNGKTVYLVIAIAGIRNGHLDILEKLAEIFEDEKTAEQLSTTVDVDEIYESLLSLEGQNAK